MTAEYQNLHTHTTYCDGALSAEEMIIAAISKGGSSIGFSEHSYVPFDEDYSMSLEDTPAYTDEIYALKEKYKEQIDVFLGIELDYFTDKKPVGMDYIIGATHHACKDGQFITVDGCARHIAEVNIKHFGGDYYAMAESYYATMTNVARKTGADIVGHFDLVAKHNINGCLFDDMHPRYLKAALDAMDELLTTCKLFEINTGAMYRLGKAVPYPSEYLLMELRKRGGEVIFSSDSHDAGSLYYKFDEMRELVKACGFKYIKRFTENGFIDERLAT